MRKRDKLKNIQELNKKLLGENNTLGQKKVDDMTNKFYDVASGDRHAEPRKGLDTILKDVESPESEDGTEWSDSEREVINRYLRSVQVESVIK